jgi:hypothetical protein
MKIGRRESKTRRTTRIELRIFYDEVESASFVWSVRWSGYEADSV